MNKDRIREIFLANGFTIKEGCDDLKPYVYEAAEALLKEARGPLTPLGERIERGDAVYGFGISGRVVAFADNDGRSMIQIRKDPLHVLLSFNEFTALIDHFAALRAEHRAIQGAMLDELQSPGGMLESFEKIFPRQQAAFERAAQKLIDDMPSMKTLTDAAFAADEEIMRRIGE